MCTSPGFQNIIGAREYFVRRERFLRTESQIPENMFLSPQEHCIVEFEQDLELHMLLQSYCPSDVRECPAHAAQI